MENNTMCDRSEVEEALDQADLDPRVNQDMREVVEHIDHHVPGVQTKGMMYDLVRVVLEMDERIRQLEYRVCGNSIQEELRRKKLSQCNSKQRYFKPLD